MSKILIVDDMDEVRSVLVEMLDALGYDQVDQANDGKQMYDKVTDAGHTPYDLIISDVNMPNMNGFEAMYNIRQQLGENAPPVVFVTGKLEQNRPLQIQYECADDHILGKPYKLTQLSEKLEQILM